jgi:hypothetical protein
MLGGVLGADCGGAVADTTVRLAAEQNRCQLLGVSSSTDKPAAAPCTNHQHVFAMDPRNRDAFGNADRKYQESLTARACRLYAMYPVRDWDRP